MDLSVLPWRQTDRQTYQRCCYSGPVYPPLEAGRQTQTQTPSFPGWREEGRQGDRHRHTVAEAKWIEHQGSLWLSEKEREADGEREGCPWREGGREK